MHKNFPALTSWNDYPRLRIDAFVDRFPDLAELEDDYLAEQGEDDDFSERHQDTELIFIEGDIAISAAQLAALGRSRDVLLVVDGSVEVEGPNRHLLYASGDVFCDTVHRDDWHMHYPVGGRVHARYYAVLEADDGAFMVTPAAIRLDTPYVFSWYYRVDELELPPETVVFLMDDGEYAATLDLPNPVFPYHDCVYVLRPGLAGEATSYGSDRIDWEIHAIEAALARGKSIFIDGFSLACMPSMRLARAELAARAWPAAFAAYRAAAILSPAYYEAWLGMGNALMGAGAFAQAIAFYRRASDLFPSRQRGLRNDAANQGAACALVCRQADVARELATLSIEHLRDMGGDRHLLGQAFNLRAEAHLMAGELERARADLASQVSYQPDMASAHWLLGLYHYKRSEHAQALAAHAMAVARNEGFARYYDAADSLAFLYKEPVVADWDGVAMADAAGAA
ncbi:tetratricopeptide repeat protein [Massilia sp. CCM 8734]|uniref:tetratricopeptide repeat protein n=1 Tax=Massilia sp. CCM 8734 TaxID=2609283 RepID=UPI001420964B|nr:tetratricopeptide repeat protein [Massilia sp. CCM 8734]NHZ99624.1 hypothetical protein [Massilia sp. CCM 8734]